MNSHSRRGAAGFSFVELLVTTIIAGIAFSAMVPLFVSASQKGAGETARNVALNLAQDKVEKIRQLDYDQITELNLSSTAFSGGGFGPTVTVSSGSSSKTYHVDYSVTFVGGTFAGQHVVNYTSGNKTETYKLVSVDVYWTGSPKPVKHAFLQTIVYKQYSGAYTNALSVLPTASGIDPNDASRLFLNSYTIALTAFVNDADALSTKNVTFTVFNSSGAQIAKLVRYVTDPQYTTPGTFTQTYTIVGAAGSQDGTYTFKATAVSKRGYEGNTAETTLPVETGAPPATTGLTATASDQKVTLAWNQSATGDVAKYEVYRKGPGDPTYGTSPIGTVDVVTGWVPGFTDTGLTNGQTYSYKVLAVDWVRNSGPLSAEVSATPYVSQDDVPPYSVTAGSAATTGTQAPPLKIRITWTGVTDQTSPSPKPTSGMYGYRIYRSDDSGVTYAELPGSPVLDTGAASYTYDDGSNLRPLKAYYYKIVAVDNANNFATSALVVSATTLNYQYCTVTVYNSNTTTGASLKVTNPDGTALDTWPGITNPTSPYSVAKKKGADWYLPVGFSFKAWYELDGTTTWSSKPIPASGNILSTTPITITFP